MPRLLMFQSLLLSPPTKFKSDTLALSSPQHLWFCCEGIFSVCGGHSSISWIYGGKSKAFYTSLSLLSTNVCLRVSRCVDLGVCARMHYLFQDFTFHWRLEVMMPPNLWWLAGYWLRPNMDSCPFALVLLHSSSLKSQTLLSLLPVPHQPRLQARAHIHTRTRTRARTHTHTHTHTTSHSPHPPAKSVQCGPFSVEYIMHTLLTVLLHFFTLCWPY